MPRIPVEDRINRNIDYLDGLNDEAILEQWDKIKTTWGASPNSSNPVMGAVIDYFLSYRLPMMALQSGDDIANEKHK